MENGSNEAVLPWQVFHMSTQQGQTTLIIVNNFCISCPARVAVHVSKTNANDWFACSSHDEVICVGDRDPRYSECFVAYTRTTPRTHVFIKGYAIHIDEKVVTSFTPATAAFTQGGRGKETITGQGINISVNSHKPIGQTVPLIHQIAQQSGCPCPKLHQSALVHVHRPPPWPTGNVNVATFETGTEHTARRGDNQLVPHRSVIVMSGDEQDEAPCDDQNPSEGSRVIPGSSYAPSEDSSEEGAVTPTSGDQLDQAPCDNPDDEGSLIIADESYCVTPIQAEEIQSDIDTGSQAPYSSSVLDDSCYSPPRSTDVAHTVNSHTEEYDEVDDDYGPVALSFNEGAAEQGLTDERYPKYPEEFPPLS